MVKPVIIGCRQPSYTREQLDYFARAQPLGLIVFGEACQSKSQLKALIESFRQAVGRADAPVLVDNEGGKVMRFKPPEWRAVPAPHIFGDLWIKDKEKASRACYLNARLLAHDMREVGVTVDCAPLLDVLHEDTFTTHATDSESGTRHATSAALHSRIFGRTVDCVTTLGQAFAEGLMDGGVTPVVKHIPGYGRVKADPHFTVTEVDESFEQLAATDFLTFKKLAHLPAAMTGHTVYKAIDPEHASTLSAKIIKGIIREHIGFKGVLITDTVEMNSIWPEGYSKTTRDKFGMGLPLPNTLGKVTRQALAAGCDIVLHSFTSFDWKHVDEIVEAAPVLSAEKLKWIMAQLTAPTPKPIDLALVRDELEHIVIP